MKLGSFTRDMCNGGYQQMLQLLHNQDLRSFITHEWRHGLDWAWSHRIDVYSACDATVLFVEQAGFALIASNIHYRDHARSYEAVTVNDAVENWLWDRSVRVTITPVGVTAIKDWLLINHIHGAQECAKNVTLWCKRAVASHLKTGVCSLVLEYGVQQQSACAELILEREHYKVTRDVNVLDHVVSVHVKGSSFSSAGDAQARNARRAVELTESGVVVRARSAVQKKSKFTYQA